MPLQSEKKAKPRSNRATKPPQQSAKENGVIQRVVKSLDKRDVLPRRRGIERRWFGSC